MANIIQQKSGTSSPASDALTKGELAIQFVAANHTAASSSKLHFGEGDSANLRQFGFGISDESNQWGIALGENLTFQAGTGLDITVRTDGTNIIDVDIDLSEFQDMTQDVDGTQDELILLDDGYEKRKRIDEIKLSQFNNDAGFITSAGTLTGIDDQSSSNDDQITITDSAVIINEDSDNLDFRVESNDNANMLFVDGQNNRVGIGKNDPSAALDITGGIITSGSVTIGSNLTIGGGTDTDHTLTFNANSNDGVLTWMEDEDYFQFSDDIFMADGEAIKFFRNASSSGHKITTKTTGTSDSSTNDTLLIDAAGFVELNATKVNLRGTYGSGLDVQGAIDCTVLTTSGNVTIGGGESGNDFTLTFNGEDSDGVLRWMEDEDYFKFQDDLLVDTTEKLLFRDSDIYINSSADGQLDIVADTEIEMTATTIDMNGAVDVSGNVTIGGNIVAAGNITADVGGDITLDADGGDIRFSDDGTQFGRIKNSNSNFIIENTVEDKDINFKGNDGGSTITALSLDMSAGGTATFSNSIHIGGNLSIPEAGAIFFDSTDTSISTNTEDPEDLFIAADQDLFLRPDNDVLIQAGTTSYAIFDGANQRVGIGTTSPQQPLHISSDENHLATFKSTDSIAEIRLQDNAAFTRLLSVGSKLKLMPNDGVELMVLDGSTERVGIGTDSPTSAVHLASATASEPVVTIENTNADGTPPGLTFFKNTTSPASSDQVGSIKFDSKEETSGDTKTYWEIQTRINDATNTTPNGQLNFYGLDGDSPGFIHQFQFINSQFSILDSNGVGPTLSTHDTNGGLLKTSGTKLKLQAKSDSTGEIHLMANNVGVGNTSPSAALDVTGAFAVSGNVTIGGNIVAAGDITADVGGEITLDTDSGNIRLKDGGTQFGAIRNSSAHLVIDNTTEDKDILFKGNDGGSAITALRLHMASEGMASFNADVQVGDDLRLNSDSSILGFGADNDVTLLHVPDTGLRLNSTRQLQFNNSDEAISSNGTNLRLKSGGTTFVVPSSDGSSGQVLQTDGAGNLSFATVSSGSGDIEGVTAGDGLTGGGSSGSVTLNVGAGDGITMNPNSVSVSAAQTTITSILNSSLVVGRGTSHANIDFSTDNEILFDIDGTQQIKFTDGAIIPIGDNDIDLGTSSLEFKDAYFDGTVTTDAITCSGNATANNFIGNLVGNASTASAIDGNSMNNALTLATGKDLTLLNTTAGGLGGSVKFNSDQTSEDATIGKMEAFWNDTRVAGINFTAGSDTTNKDEGKITFNVARAGGAYAKVATIDEGGSLGIGGEPTGIGLLTLDGANCSADPILAMKETSAPSATSNYGKIYVKSSDSNLYFMDENGSETQLNGGGGGGSIDGSGATNRVAFWSDSDTLSSDADMTWDSSLGILKLSHDVAQTQLELESTVTTTTSGPRMTFYRNSATPDDGDTLARLIFKGNTNLGGNTNILAGNAVYADIIGKINTATEGQTDGQLIFRATVNGTDNDEIMKVGANSSSGREVIPGEDNETNLGNSSDGWKGVYARTYYGYDTSTASYLAGASESPSVTYNMGSEQLIIQTDGGIVTDLRAQSTSDENLKENITANTTGLSFINQLTPKNFTWKQSYADHNRMKENPERMGWIAQDVEKISSDYVEKIDYTEDGTEFLGLTNKFKNDLIAAQINAIKELSAKNDALEARIAALEAK